MASIPVDDDTSDVDSQDSRSRSRDRIPSGSKTDRDASSREYWRRVRSLSRESKQRQEARDRHARRLELEERRRREQILADRKKKRDTMTNRFLREPIRQQRLAHASEKAAFRKVKHDGESELEDVLASSSEGGLNSMNSSQSVPDLEEALRIVRGEDQALDARAHAFMSTSSRRRPVQEEEPVCDRFLRTHNRPPRSSTGLPRRGPVPATRPFPPGSTDDVIRENQKPYPTRPPEELLARTRQLRGKSARDENDSLKLGTTKVLNDTFNVGSGGQSTELLLAEYRPPVESHIMVLPRPKLERRSSMPDLRDFRCVSSAVVYETIATLGRLGEARGLLVVPPGEKSTAGTIAPTPEIHKDLGEKANAYPQHWARKMNKLIHEETQAVLQASPLLERLSPANGHPGAAKGRRTQRKEWVSKHTSVKTLQKNILPKTLMDSSSQTETIRPVSAVRRRRNSIGSEDAESVYYDSLEEEDSKSTTHKAGHQAFYVPITAESLSTLTATPTLPARLTARLEERRAASRRASKSEPLGVSSLALNGKRVQLIDEAKMAQAIASGVDINALEASELIDAESDSDILDSPRAKSLRKEPIITCSSEQDTDTSQSDILQLSSEIISPQKGNAADPKNNVNGHENVPIEADPQVADTTKSLSEHSNSSSCSELLDVQIKETNMGDNKKEECANAHVEFPDGRTADECKTSADGVSCTEEKDSAPKSIEKNDNIKIQVTDENGEDINPNSEDEANSSDLPFDIMNVVNGERDNVDTEISDHYGSETFHSASGGDSIQENVVSRDVENGSNTSIQESVDSVSDSLEEVSENLVSEVSEDDALQKSNNEIQEDSNDSPQEQYEIIGFTSNGKETLLESGFIDCDDPSLLPEPLSINCDEIAPTLIQTSRCGSAEDIEACARLDCDAKLLEKETQEKNDTPPSDCKVKGEEATGNMNTVGNEMVDDVDFVLTLQTSLSDTDQANIIDNCVQVEANSELLNETTQGDDNVTYIDMLERKNEETEVQENESKIVFDDTKINNENESFTGEESEENSIENLENLSQNEESDLENPDESLNQNEKVVEQIHESLFHSEDNDVEANECLNQNEDSDIENHDGSLSQNEDSDIENHDGSLNQNEKVVEKTHEPLYHTEESDVETNECMNQNEENGEEIHESMNQNEETLVETRESINQNEESDVEVHESLIQNGESEIKSSESMNPRKETDIENQQSLSQNEYPENDADNEELSDGTDSWDRVTVVRVSSGSASGSRNDTPDLDIDVTEATEDGNRDNASLESLSSVPELTADALKAANGNLLDEIFRSVSPSEGRSSPIDESSSGLSTIDEDDEHLECVNEEYSNPLLDDTVVEVRRASHSETLGEEEEEDTITEDLNEEEEITENVVTEKIVSDVKVTHFKSEAEEEIAEVEVQETLSEDIFLKEEDEATIAEDEVQDTLDLEESEIIADEEEVKSLVTHEEETEIRDMTIEETLIQEDTEECVIEDFVEDPDDEEKEKSVDGETLQDPDISEKEEIVRNIEEQHSLLETQTKITIVEENGNVNIAEDKGAEQKEDIIIDEEENLVGEEVKEMSNEEMPEENPTDDKGSVITTDETQESLIEEEEEEDIVIEEEVEVMQATFVLDEDENTLGKKTLEDDEVQEEEEEEEEEEATIIEDEAQDDVPDESEDSVVDMVATCAVVEQVQQEPIIENQTDDTREKEQRQEILSEEEETQEIIHEEEIESIATEEESVQTIVEESQEITIDEADVTVADEGVTTIIEEEEAPEILVEEELEETVFEEEGIETIAEETVPESILEETVDAITEEEERTLAEDVHETIFEEEAEDLVTEEECIFVEEANGLPDYVEEATINNAADTINLKENETMEKDELSPKDSLDHIGSDPDKDVDEDPFSIQEVIDESAESDHELDDKIVLSSHIDSDGMESLLMSDATLDMTEPATQVEYEELLNSVIETEIKAEYEELIGSDIESTSRDTYQEMIEEVESNIEQRVFVSDKKVSRTFNSCFMKADSSSASNNYKEKDEVLVARAVWKNDDKNEEQDELGAPAKDLGDEAQEVVSKWAMERSASETGSSGERRPAEVSLESSSSSSDASPRVRIVGEAGEAVAATNSPSSDSGVMEMAGKNAHSPSDASVEEAVTEDRSPRGPDAQDSSRSEESVRSAPPNRRTSKQAKDRANRITSGRRSSSGCGRASLDAEEVGSLRGWTTFTAPDDNDIRDPKHKRRHWEAPLHEEFQNLPPQADSDGASISRHRLVQEYLDSLHNHQVSKDGSPRCTVGSPPHSLNDLPTDNLSDIETSESGDMSYSERLLRVLESRRSRRHRPRSSNIDGDDTPNRYRPSTLSALDVFLATLSRYRGGQPSDDDPPQGPSPTSLTHDDDDDNVTVQVKTGARQHDVRVSSRRQVRLVVNVGNPVNSSDSGCAADVSQSQRSTKRASHVSGASPAGRRHHTKHEREARAPPPQQSRADAPPDPEVDQLLSDVREYLNTKLTRQGGADENREQASSEGIVVEGSNIEKCFTERPPPGGGRLKLFPKTRTKQEEKRLRAMPDPKQKEKQRIQHSISAINALLKQFS